MAGKRLLVLNVEVSNMNTYLFDQLRKNGWELNIQNVPYPKRLRYWAMLTTFTPNLGVWKKRFDYRLNKMYKSPWCFKWRTRWCERLIHHLEGQFDLILNIISMYAPYLDKSGKPYVVYTDYTMALAEKYEPWATDARDFPAWLELESKLYQNAALNFVGSENTRQSLIHDYQAAPERVVNMGFGVPFKKIKDFDKTYDGKTILFVGYDFERKGGFVLLEAFQHIQKEIPDARLIIIGPNKSIYPIEAQGVEFVGTVKNQEQLKDYYHAASVFVLPSLCEPFGFVFLEAMGHKLPCVGARVDAMPEIIEEGKMGELVEPDNAEELAEKLITLLKDQDRLTAYGQKAFQKALKANSWDTIGTNFCEQLERMNNAS